MAFLDIVLGGLLVWGLIKGIRNGLFVELASLISFYVGIYIAVKFSHVVGNALGGDSSKSLKIISFLITFIAVVVGIHLLAKVFSKIAGFVFLGWLNRLAGGLFGTIRAMLYLGVCLALLAKISTGIFSKETREESIFYNPITKTSKFILPVLEKSFSDLKKTV